MDLFKKKTTSWIIDGKRVATQAAGATRVTIESKKWYGTVNGKQQPLSEDKTTATKMLRKMLTDADLSKLGLGDPFAPHRNKSIDEHLKDYEAILIGKGSDKRHVQKVLSRIRAITTGCKFKVIADIDHGTVSAWLAEQRKPRPLIQLPRNVESFKPSDAATIFGVSLTALSGMVKRHGLAATGNGKARRLPRSTLEAIANRIALGISPETTNHYIRTIRAFSRWLERSNRMQRNPLEDLALLNTQLDIRHARRELTAEELRRLLDGTNQSKRCFRGLTGVDRACLYLTAAATGFRARALANLCPRDYELQGELPVVILAARFNKSRKPKIQPLPREAAMVLIDYLSIKPPSKPVWGSDWQTRGAEMIRSDLEEAGIPYVIEGSDGPQYADFHALRHSYLTLLGRSGVDLRTTQVLAGHSTPLLTARYSHRNLNDLSEAVGKLPTLTNMLPTDFNVKARVFLKEQNVCTQFAQTPGDLSYLQPSADTEQVDEHRVVEVAESPTKHAETVNNKRKKGIGPSRIRTCNQGIMSRLNTSHKLVTDQGLTTDVLVGLHAVCTEPQGLLTDATTGQKRQRDFRVSRPLKKIIKNQAIENSAPVITDIHDLKPRKLSMMAAALQILQDRKAAMTCPEIIDVLATEGLWVSPCGKTPAATLSAAISRRIKDLGSASPIKKAEKGKFEAVSLLY